MSFKQEVLDIIQDEIDSVKNNFPYTHDDEVKVDKLTDVYDLVKTTFKEFSSITFIEKFWKIIDEHFDHRDMLTYGEIQMIFDSIIGSNRYELIPAWRNKKLRCDFCGNNRSVKYTKKVHVPIKDGLKINLRLCNKCAAQYSFSKLPED